MMSTPVSEPQSLPPAAVLGVPIHIFADYTDWVIRRLQQGIGTHIATLNAEMVMQALQNPSLASAIEAADLVVPDGAGIVLHFKLRGKSVQRCPGIELAESLVQAIATLGNPYTVFFFGAAPGVADQAAQASQQKFPGLQVAGVQDGYLKTPEAEAAFSQRLQDLQPSLILVALGVPRQETWILEHRHLCPNSIWIGVGGSLDIWAGLKVRAPQWLCDRNLEWTYRLYKEPWRWKRMMALPKFAWKSLVDLI